MKTGPVRTAWRLARAAPLAFAAGLARAADTARSAAGAAPAYSGPTPMNAPSAGSLLQTIFALTLVLALLAALAWFLKRYGPKAGAGPAGLRVVGALSLGGRERIVVVEVGEQWIVVGASPGRINALATMARQEGVVPAPPASIDGGAAGNFAHWLHQTMERRNAK
jgi:flagellar protein FliO/FliZ